MSIVLRSTLENPFILTLFDSGISQVVVAHKPTEKVAQANDSQSATQLTSLWFASTVVAGQSSIDFSYCSKANLTDLPFLPSCKDESVHGRAIGDTYRTRPAQPRPFGHQSYDTSHMPEGFRLSEPYCLSCFFVAYFLKIFCVNVSSVWNENKYKCQINVCSFQNSIVGKYGSESCLNIFNVILQISILIESFQVRCQMNQKHVIQVSHWTDCLLVSLKRGK